jgi:hypothetical protein
MLKRYIPVLVVFSLIVSCDKDKLETKPTLKIIEYNTKEVFPGQDLLIRLEYGDKEGDLGTGVLTYVRNRININPITDPSSNDKADTIDVILPDFPKTSKGEFDLKIAQGFLGEDPFENDTMFFKIYVRDVAGNTSDTAVTETIVERQN